MTNRKIGMIIFLLCFCLHLMPCQAMAASTSDAIEPILPENECQLTVSYRCAETALSDVQVRLYRIAEVSADLRYTLTPAFAASGLSLDGIRTAGEWNVIRATLEAHIIAHSIASDATSVTDKDGQARFEGLKTGMYLATVDLVEQNKLHYLFESALIPLPALGQDGRWQYQTSVNAKGEVLPPVNPDEETELKILKLWRGDEGRNDRPKSIEVEIFCNGNSYKTVTLSAENQWAYSWSAPDDGSRWTVVERNIPKGYTATVEERSGTFVLTNTRIPSDPDVPVKPPQTGDTTNIMLYVLLMIGSGCMLIILGITGKRSRL